MRNRDYKQFGPGEYFHIYNRGNRKGVIFLDDEDYGFFILRLRQNLFPDKKMNPRAALLPDDSFSLVSYCLMPNHFHFLIRQNKDLPTSRLLLRICTSYSMFFNKKYNKVGHLFQDRFKQIFIKDTTYLTWLSAYIHQNPMIAGLVKNPAEFMWSSYTDFIGLRDDNLCRKNIILDQFGSINDYREFVESSYNIIKRKKGIEDFILD